MSSNASPSKRKPTKKKQITTMSPRKSRDIRATTNRCGNYIPTRISSILDKLSQASKKIKKNCYFCQYSLYNCSILQRKTRRNNIECLAGWFNETPQLPDIDLINDFNYELLLQYANSTSDSGFSSGNENNNCIQKDKKENEITNNLQVKEFGEKHLSEIENNIFIRNKNYADDKINIGDIQDKQYFDVEQEHDKDPKTKKTLEYFGLNCIEDMFTGSDDESDSTIIYSPNYPTKKVKSIYVMSDSGSDLEAGYQSDCTIIYSPNYPTNKVKSIYVISDSKSDLEVNTNTCNDGKSLRKRHINESDSEGPVCKSKKSGHQQMKRNTANTSTTSTSVSTHAAYKNKARDVQTTVKQDNECDDKETAYESDNIVDLSNNSVKNESDSDSENRKLPREPNNESDSKGPMIKSAYTPIVNNVIDSSSTKNSVDINTISSITVSDNNRNLSNNRDMSTNSKLQKKQNIEYFNEVQEIESASNEKTPNIASFTVNNSINIPFDDNDDDVLVIERNISCTVISDSESDSENKTDINTNTSPFDNNDNDVQVMETNVPCVFISDTDSNSENNTDINTKVKLQTERNNEPNNKCLVIESVNEGMNKNTARFTSNETITLPFDDNDNGVQVIETNVPCVFISDTDSNSDNNTDINTKGKLQTERNNEPNNKCLVIESVNEGMNKNIARFTSNETITLPFDDNDNDVQVIETNVPCVFISDTDSNSDNNTYINTKGKLQTEPNNDSNNECLVIESVNEGMNKNIARFTSNETITLPIMDGNDNNIQIIETNEPCIIISDTDPENNIDTNGKLKLLRDRNNEANPEGDDVSASNKVIATCAITDSDNDLDDGWLDQYLRF